jgi:hypothetical protein
VTRHGQHNGEIYDDWLGLSDVEGLERDASVMDGYVGEF